VLEAAARHGLRAPIWIAGRHEKNAFRRFHVWSTPLFVRVDDMQVAAVTPDVDVACRWLPPK